VLVQVDRFGQGGLEQVIVDLLAAFRRESIQVVFLAVEEPAVPATLTRLVDRVARLPAGDRETTYRDLLIQEQIDLVSSHYSLYGARAAYQRGIPFVQTVQNTYVWLTPDQIAAHQQADPFTSAYACVSREVARYTQQKLGLSAEKIQVLPNGVAGERFCSVAQPGDRMRVRTDLALPAEAFVFLNVASIFPPKAQRLALRALRRLRDAGQDAWLVFLGGVFDAEYQQQLQDDTRRLQLQDRVIFAGRRPDVPAFYHAADAFLLPSFWEGCSLALAEALLSGLPCVISRVGSAEELADIQGVEQVDLPFTSILELDHRNLEKFLRSDHPEFVERLAQAMLRVRQQPVRPVLSPAQRLALDRDTMSAAYLQLFTQLLQGEITAASRAA
jgi:glycosyltransferase involved in cell wall biosynthesis